jgi:hypothetical protein
MELKTAIEGMLTVRAELQQPEGISLPTFISEKIQILAQFVGVIEITLAEKEESLAINEAKKYKEYIDAGKKTSTAKDLARFDFIAEHAEINRLSRYISSSWMIT